MACWHGYSVRAMDRSGGSPHTSYDTEGTAVNEKVRRRSAAAVDKNRERQSRVSSLLSLLHRFPQNPTRIGLTCHWLWILCSFGINEPSLRSVGALEVFVSQFRQLKVLLF